MAVALQALKLLLLWCHFTGGLYWKVKCHFSTRFFTILMILFLVLLLKTHVISILFTEWEMMKKNSFSSLYRVSSSFCVCVCDFSRLCERGNGWKVLYLKLYIFSLLSAVPWWYFLSVTYSMLLSIVLTFLIIVIHQLAMKREKT